MTTAFKLAAKVLALRVPPRVLVFGLLNKINYLARTGNRRFEFERLYLEDPDPWNYASSAYERDKYERTLAAALTWRTACARALEIGCSVGVFTEMIATHFDGVVAIDVSKEALRTAVRRNDRHAHVCFLHEDFRSAMLAGAYDVVFCAEVLYYIMEKDAEIVCRQLERYLAPAGVLVLATGVPRGPASPFYFNGWSDLLSVRFRRVATETVPDPSRPYEVTVFARRG